MDNIVQEAEKIISRRIGDHGNFPNNPTLPLLLYKQSLHINEGDAESVEEVFAKNDWGNSWRNGIYGYHHYHSTAHEVLGIYSGSAKVQLGGPDGIKYEVKTGDVIIIPAGVAHKKLGATADFACVGAYPPGQHFDMNYGKSDERPRVDENIKSLSLPKTDPVYGDEGELIRNWHSS
ncbi:uncharacterized protein YjlB [Catalinimonas alkaloidigena]|uniref:cupin domain-containing protein n=1 Tax=Catalinimonas alkaloidigena TaxID=1075417 RepID=UPI00240508F4|nr:cupin domain-containing protein [Catalinimonas alkaloidigena]MDF9797736.1 uncharacterized protein YjlB [Catalinimonas alkaloidigena]